MTARKHSESARNRTSVEIPSFADSDTEPEGATVSLPDAVIPGSVDPTDILEIILAPVMLRPVPVPPTTSRRATSLKSPREWTGSEPPFEVPEWANLACATVSPEQMGRHTLILGETGSGKTKSGIFPLVTAAVSYGAGDRERSLAPAMLIIDPKLEITTRAQEVNRRMGLERKIIPCVIGEGEWTLDFLEGVDQASLSADEYVTRLFSVSVSAEAESGDARNAFFYTQAQALLRDLVAVDLYLWQKAGGSDAVEVFWGTVLNHALSLTDIEGLDLGTSAPNYIQRYLALINLAGMQQQAVLSIYTNSAAACGVPKSKLLVLESLGSLASDTFTSIVATLNNRLGELASPELARRVSTNPFLPPEKGRLSVLDALNDGHIVCYYPRDNSITATIIGRCLKTKFFELAFERDNLDRPFVYVCDEFQRFITNDPTSGEQSFLDRCRAYRGICILATQSMASLRYALGRDGANDADASALEILLNNTGNKLFFRNTDEQTHGRLRTLIPSAPIGGKPHITEARPVSTLKVGECYYLLSDGRWGRRRIALGRPHQPGFDDPVFKNPRSEPYKLSQ